MHRQVFGPNMDQPLAVDIVDERFTAAAAEVNAAFPGNRPKDK